MKIIMFFLLLVLTPYSAFALDLVEGELDGSIKFHNRDFVPATFLVQTTGNEDEPNYKIEMIHDERFYNFEKLRLSDKPNMSFYLNTGKEYKCSLSLDEKAKNDIEDCKSMEGYCGECLREGDEEKQKLIIINLKLPIPELELELELEPEPELEPEREPEPEPTVQDDTQQ